MPERERGEVTVDVILSEIRAERKQRAPDRASAGRPGSPAGRADPLSAGTGAPSAARRLARWVYGLFKAPSRIRDLHFRSLEAERRLEERVGVVESAFAESVSAAVRRLERLEGEEQARDERIVRLEEGRDHEQGLIGEIQDSARSSAESLAALRDAYSRLEGLLVGVRAEIEAHRLQLEADGAAIAAAGERTRELGRDREEMMGTLLRLQRAEETGQAGLEEVRERLAHLRERVNTDVGPPDKDELYLALENRFRGTRDLIKERQRIYLPLLREAGLGTRDRPVLDLGCGRGEWLELLAENGLSGRGVDANSAAVAGCRRAGLEAIHAPALPFLRGLPAESIGAVTAFHLLEHLPFEVCVLLIDETVRVLQSGGVAVFESPDPSNLLVASYEFHLDPTHRKPLPSPLLRFLLEARGLSDVAIRPLHPAVAPAGGGETPGGAVPNRFSGPQDYAAIGWKRSSPVRE